MFRADLLRGKTALVTGASSGLGRHFAGVLAKHGAVETDLNRDFLRSDDGAALGRRVPMRRFGMPEDLDGVLLLLASAAGAYMTSATSTVDGGHSLAWL